MFILTSLTLPLAAWTAFSRIGVSWRQGPHHGAQKSISTGWRFDSWMTSLTKVWVVVSLIRSVATGAAGPPPCSTMVTGILVCCLGLLSWDALALFQPYLALGPPICI